MEFSQNVKLICGGEKKEPIRCYTATGRSSGKQNQQTNEGFPSSKNVCGLVGIGHEERCSQTETKTTVETSPQQELNIHYVSVYSVKKKKNVFVHFSFESGTQKIP